MARDAELNQALRSARAEKKRLQRALDVAWSELQAVLARNNPEIERLQEERRGLRADAAEASAAAEDAFAVDDHDEAHEHIERAQLLRADAETLWDECGVLIEENRAARAAHGQARKKYLAAKDRLTDAETAVDDRREALGLSREPRGDRPHTGQSRVKRIRFSKVHRGDQPYDHVDANARIDGRKVREQGLHHQPQSPGYGPNSVDIPVRRTEPEEQP